MGSDWQVQSEEGADEWAVASEEHADEWAVASEQPLGPTGPRRGGNAAEARRTASVGRGASGFNEQDPRRLDLRLNPQAPLPDGVVPSTAGAGRGFAVEPRGERRGYMSGHAPLRDRRETLDEAVNLLDEGADPAKVYETFGRMKISPDEIAAHGQTRKSPFFAPQTTRPAENGILAGQEGSDSIAPADIGGARDALNAVRRGAEQAKGSIDTGLFLAGVTKPSDFAEQLRTSERRMAALAPSEATVHALDRLQEANKTGQWGPVLHAVADPENWRGLMSLVTESAVASAPVMVAGSLATALGGVAGGMPVAALASFSQEYTAALGDEMEKRKVNAADPAAVAALLQDDDFRQDMDRRGRIRGAAVGAFDAITLGFAGALGRSLRRLESAGKLTAGRAAGGAAAGAAAEVAGGMAGERLGQAGVGENKPLDVLVEGLAEAPSGVADVAAGFLKPRIAKAPTQARAEALQRFDEMAAAFGINPKAVARAKEAVSGMPAGEVPNFLAKLADSLSQKGLVAKPIDAEGMRSLHAAVDPEHEAKAPAEVSAAKVIDEVADDEPGAAPEAEGPAHDHEADGDGEAAPAPGGAGPAAVDSIEATLRAAGALPAPAEPAAHDIAGQAEGTGQGAGPADARLAAFTPESGTLGIPRDQMPQVAAEHRGALVQFLAARGITHESGEVDPGTLKPTQASFNPKAVQALAERPGGGRSVLVSSDGHILDGHHQALAAQQRGELVKVIQLAAPIQDLLRLSHQFPSSTTAPRPRANGQSPTPLKAPHDLQQPDLAVPAPATAGAAVAGRDQPGGSGRSVGPDAVVPGRLDQLAAAAPPAGGAPGVAVSDAGRRDAAPLTRPLGKVGRTPSAADPVELRTNADGTLTPYTGKTPMLDFDSGEPIVIPAGATDAQAVEAIRQAGAVSSRSKFFGIENELTSNPNGDAARGAGTTNDQTPERKAAIERDVEALKGLLKCLMS